MKFNTVLVPPSEIGNASIDFAQAHYAHNHDDYCLGSDGHLPHITLAQTEIPEDEKVALIHSAIKLINENFMSDVELQDYYHDLDRGYCGVSVELSSDLKILHEQIVKIHEDLGLNILSSHSGNYCPHVTFAKTFSQLPENTTIPDILQGISNGWKVEFGHMGNHGVYLGKYKP